MENQISILSSRAKRVLVFLILALVASFAQASAPEQALGILDTIVNTFRGSTDDYLHNAITLAKNTFLILAAIELAWTGAQLALKQGELSDLVAGIFFKILALSFFFFIVLGMASTWVPAVINTFMQAGNQITGASVVLNPTSIMREGINSAANVLRHDGFFGRLISGGLGIAILSSLVAAIAAVGIIVGFFVVAVTLMIVLIESFIVIGAGAIMLAFSGSRWTAQIAEKYFAYAISVGAKLMTIFVIAGLGSVLANAINRSLAGDLSMAELIAIGAIGLLYGMLGVKIPSIAGSMLSGAASMGFGDAQATAQKAVGGAAGGVGLVAGAIAGVAKLAAMALAAKTTGVGAIAGAAASGVGKAATSAVGGAANAGKSAFGAASGAIGGGRGGNQQGNGSGQVAGGTGASFTNGAVGSGGGGGFGGAGGSSSGGRSSGGSSSASSGGAASSSSEQQSQSSAQGAQSEQPQKSASSGGGAASSSSFDSSGDSDGGSAGFSNPASYGGGGGSAGDGIDRTDSSKPMTMQQRIDASPAARRARQIAKAADWLSRKSDRISRDNRTRINEGHTGAPPSIRFGDRD